MATKKIKKVETPIDERETFVSLQKAFADTETGVEEKLKTLYELQKADTAIDTILQFRGELPAEVEELEVNLASIKAKAAQTEELIKEYTRSIDVNKDDIVDLDAQISKYQEQMDNISNSREYDSLNKELENLGLLRQIAEKRIGEAKIAISEKKDVLEDLGRRIEIVEEDARLKKEELANIVESTSQEEFQLRDIREKCASSIDARTMSAYERIRASVNNHLAVVTVYNGNACGGCFNTITPQRLLDIDSNKKLVICEHCGRIIVNPDFE